MRHAGSYTRVGIYLWWRGRFQAAAEERLRAAQLLARVRQTVEDALICSDRVPFIK